MVTVECERLHVRLGRRTVLHDISARLEAGHLIGIIGPNGAGKSTLVRTMLGLIPPAAGTIMLDGQALKSFSRRDIARRLAYLPQGQTLHWPLRAERLVALGRLPHLGPMSRISRQDETAIAEAMAKADVSFLRHRLATELSGGERARVLFARALAVGAPGLIADEPLASLDPGHQIEVMELMRQEANRGSLVVAVMHDLTLAARYCDRLLLIDRGRLVTDGRPFDVLTPERLDSVYGIRAFIGPDRENPMIVPLERRTGAQTD